MRERFYAISVKCKLKHPAVVATTEAARGETVRLNSAQIPCGRHIKTKTPRW
jgi:hypothetical protein